MNLTLIDYSSAIYASSFRCATGNSPDDFRHYKDTLDKMTDTILEETKADYYIAFGDGMSSFRKRMFSEFKGTRVEKKKEVMFLTDLKRHARDRWGTVISEDLEADDLCLIHKRHVKEIFPNEEVTVTIASIDSDLRQEEGYFYDYGYRRKRKGPPKEPFEYISSDQARLNLYMQVLMKGHNDKLDYLEGCGRETAIKYLAKFSPPQYAMATMHAFMHGIDKNIYDVHKSIHGYGEMKGVLKFGKSFQQSYLLKTAQEAEELGCNFTLAEPIKVNKIEQLPI